MPNSHKESFLCIADKIKFSQQQDDEAAYP